MERLKQKVAASRVFASLQQVAAGQSSCSSAGASDNGPQASQETRPPPVQVAKVVVPEAAMSTAWLMAADATAHLTDEERGILLEVFKKEEQFQRDTIKQLSASRAQLEHAQQLREQQHQVERQQRESSNRRPSRRLLGKYRAASNQSLACSPATSASHTPTSGSATQPASRACSCSASACGLHATPAPTPNSSDQRNQPEARASSSSATNEQPADFGQCRICRKTIGSSEPCHLCSNCQQFVCDDCASYSSTDQHWMCSSCRRRTMTPAIPAEALKELGLNQNSSAVRRMTLRLNQNELKLALDRKNSAALLQQHQMAPPAPPQQQQQAAESTTSSSSNSAASSRPHCNASRSNSNRTTLQTAQRTDTPTRANKPLIGALQEQQQQQSEGRALPSRPKSQRSLERGAQERKRTGRISSSPTGQRQPQHAASCDTLLKSRPQAQHSQSASAAASARETQPSRGSSASQSAAGSRPVGGSAGGSPSSGGGTRRSYCEMRASKLAAQKTMSQPICKTQDGAPFVVYQPTGSNGQPFAAATQRQVHQRQVMQQQQQARTSVAAPLSSQPLEGAGVETMQHYGQQYYSPEHQVQQDHHTYGAHYAQVQPFAQQSQQHNWSQQSIMSQQQECQQQAQRPNEIGSFVGSSPRNSRRGSRHQLSIEEAPMQQLAPSEQLHMRRLSDQSNLVRRSSIISDQLEGQMARNRSHSNIDTVHQVSSYLNQTHHQQQQQQPLHMRPFEGEQMQFMAYQQHQSDQQLHSSAYLSQGTLNRAHLSLGQSEQMSSVSTSNVLNLPHQVAQMAHQRRLSDSGQYMIAANFQHQQQMASVITSSAQKLSRRRQSFDDGNQPDYSSSDSELDGKQHGRQQAYNNFDRHPKQQAPITIPSVSVSEFRQAARRQSIQLQQQQQHQHQNQHQHQHQHQHQLQHKHDQLLFAQDNQITPNQINVAIEQVIQQQRQHEQQLLGGNHKLEQQLLQLSARRGSSGRVLPRIPGQQSRSLLELPHSLAASQQIASGQQNSLAADPLGAQAMANGLSNEAGRAGQMLDLPLLSPTVRRASAPEGQNIKIVVDDIDHNQHGVANFTRSAQFQYQQYHTAANSKFYAQHDFYERHILCRDDSLDPNGLEVGRGFGLQVMGGKLDQDGKLQALITWVLPAGPADKVGLCEGDKIIEWDGKCLVDMSYEQVAEVIESSANVAELLVKPTPQRLNDPQQAPTSYLLSGRRLSQQTERDLRRAPQSRPPMAAPGPNQATPKRASSGGRRKLPQIPGGELGSTYCNGSANQLDERLSNLRHASTGHLEQNARLPTASELVNQQQLSNSARSQLSGIHLNPFAGKQQEQHQTRSASELHRASVAGLNDPSYPQQQQQQQHMIDGPPLGGWLQAQHQQQYGGSQQMVPSNVGVQLSVRHQVAHYGSQTNALSATGGPDETRGLIGLQVNVDERLGTLEICILAAHNIERDPSLDYCVRVKILPENARFKVCTTQPSCDMNWKESFLFQKFPVQNIQRMALEIGVWVHQEIPRLSAEPAQPICEALIPIQSARERHIDFWPMRPPPTSPGGRRKSLNDLMGDHFAQQQQQQQQQQQHQQAHNVHELGHLLSADSKQTRQAQPPWQGDAIAAVRQIQQKQQHKRTSPMGSSARLYQPNANDSPTMMSYYQRERSSSNRNLPETNKLNVQPRRASDEVATSSSHRLLARISPAASRRSISVINVAGDSQVGCSNRSRLGSQANMMRAAQVRRDSGQQPNSNNSPKKFSSCSPSGGSISRASESSQTGPLVGTTPSGRRSSLIGVQSMTGYRSQKNSQSDATDHESPLSLNKRGRELASGQVAQQQVVSATSGGLTDNKVATKQPQEQQGRSTDSRRRPSMSKNQQARQASSGPTSTRQSCSSNGGSRRGSCEPQPAHLQRHGSFAMQTLRKLKRTMSLSKNDSPTGSNQGSRKSSDASNHSEADLCEDLAVSKAVRPHDSIVGRIKLSFIMTKGQFEVEVICASGLKLDHQESALGVYVKMYLKGRNKSNKRKTRTVQQQLDSPIFRQTIRYDGSLVDNKLLEFKYRGLRRMNGSSLFRSRKQ